MIGSLCDITGDGMTEDEFMDISWKQALVAQLGGVVQ